MPLELHAPIDLSALLGAEHLIALFDGHPRLVYVSRELEAATGLKADELVGCTHRDWGLSPEQARRWSAALEQALEGKSADGLVLPIPTPGGARDVTASLVPVRGRNGRVAAILLRAYDESDSSPGRLLASAIHHLPAGVAILEAPTAKVLFANPEHGRIFGTGPPVGFTLNGRRMSVEECPVFRALFRGEAVAAQEMELQRSDGSRSAVRISSAPIRDGSGAVVACVVVCYDISGAQRERRRQAFLSEVGLLFARSLDMSASLDGLARLAVPFLSDFCLVHFAADPGPDLVALEHLEAEKVASLKAVALRPREAGWRGSAASRVLAGEAASLVERIEDVFVCPIGDEDGPALSSLCFVSGMVVPLLGRTGVLGVISFATGESARRLDRGDLELAEELGRRAGLALENARLYESAQVAQAEVRAREAELRRAYERAKEAERRKDEFLAVLGHELRNPLAPIATALQLMRLNGQCSKEHDVIERQMRHLTRLVDDLLDVSRIARGQVSLEREPLEVGAVLARAIETVSPLLEQKRHRLTVEAPPQELHVMGDETRLAQVFSNLLVNAARYTPPGGHVSVGAALEGEQVVVRVRDDGEGIAPELLPRIFELFARGDRPLTRGDGGLGLGLYLVKGLVELHGGRVSARSEGPGRGSEFSVWLPAAEGDVSREQARWPERVPDGRGRKVLVVDDNRDAATLLAEVLESCGFEVRVALDPAQALSVMEGFSADVAVLDIGLPLMDGYELAAKLRQTYGRRLVLVAVTGYGQDSDRAKAKAAGFDAHWVKPVDALELAESLASSPEAS